MASVQLSCRILCPITGRFRGRRGQQLAMLSFERKAPSLEQSLPTAPGVGVLQVIDEKRQRAGAWPLEPDGDLRVVSRHSGSQDL